MGKIKARFEIVVHEDGGDPAHIGTTMRLESHHRNNGALGWVVITTPDGREFTVSGVDLEKASARCRDCA